MFAFIEGLLDYVGDDYCVIDAGGFGINVFISGRTAANLPDIGSHVKLYTYTSVREDAISLYGFDTREDLNMYKKLITVKGIGPKGGLSLLSVMDADTIKVAIVSEDDKKISSAPGIGRKTALMLILELKDKLKVSDEMIIKGMTGSDAVVYKESDKSLTGEMNDAISALVALGYGAADSKKAVLSVENSENMNSGDLLSAALKKLF